MKKLAPAAPYAIPTRRPPPSKTGPPLIPGVIGADIFVLNKAFGVSDSTWPATTDLPPLKPTTVTASEAANIWQRGVVAGLIAGGKSPGFTYSRQKSAAEGITSKQKGRLEVALCDKGDLDLVRGRRVGVDDYFVPDMMRS